MLGFLREVTRLGPPASTRLLDRLEPLVARAAGFLEAEMDAGRMRRHDPRLLLLAAYSMVTAWPPRSRCCGPSARRPPWLARCAAATSCSTSCRAALEP